MQTFLPYPDFTQSAACLDNKRLGKQRVECLQILSALSDPNYGWQHHPAVKMWRGYERDLINYAFAVMREWSNRGYKNTLCWDKINNMTYKFPLLSRLPVSWLGNPAFHSSHRSNLLRKDPTWYSQFGWTEPNNLPYVWPI